MINELLSVSLKIHKIKHATKKHYDFLFKEMEEYFYFFL